MDRRRFENSTLSPDQIEFIGKAMSAMHREKDIFVATESSTHIFPSKTAIVGEKRLQKIWRSSVEVTMDMLLSYFDTKSEVEYSTYLSDAKKIEESLGNPKNNTRLEKLKKILAEIKKILDGEDMRQLLKEYREEFRKIPKPENNVWHDSYEIRFATIIRNDIKKALGEVLPQDLNPLIFESMVDLETNL